MHEHCTTTMCKDISMKFLCIISGCPAGARKWHISDFAMLLHSKKEAPSLFCFGMSHQALPTAQCSDGALICIDLAHIIEVECVIGLDHQLVRPVLFNVKGVSFIEVGELPILWMLRDVVFVTEKRSHASKL